MRKSLEELAAKKKLSKDDVTILAEFYQKPLFKTLLAHDFATQNLDMWINLSKKLPDNFSSVGLDETDDDNDYDIIEDFTKKPISDESASHSEELQYFSIKNGLVVYGGDVDTYSKKFKKLGGKRKKFNREGTRFSGWFFDNDNRQELNRILDSKPTRNFKIKIVDEKDIAKRFSSESDDDNKLRSQKATQIDKKRQSKLRRRTDDDDESTDNDKKRQSKLRLRNDDDESTDNDKKRRSKLRLRNDDDDDSRDGRSKLRLQKDDYDSMDDDNSNNGIQFRQSHSVEEQDDDEDDMIKPGQRVIPKNVLKFPNRK